LHNTVSVDLDNYCF